MPEPSPTDAELVAQTLAENREAFGRLFDRYASLVRAVVAGVSGDWSAADDMVQDCFLRAYRKLPDLREPGRFGSWIVGIARHVGRERRRTLRRDRHEFRDTQLWEMQSSTDTNAELHDRDQLELVMRRIAILDERERIAVHAFFLKQQDARQAAEALGLSRSGFYSLLQRALARLATSVKHCDPKERTKS